MSKRKINLNPQSEKQADELSTKPHLFNKKNIICLSLILILAIIVFWKTTKNGFTDWDDNLYVVNSDLVKQLNWNAVKSYFTTVTARLYTPLVTLSYAIDFKLYGMEASGFHTTNLMLHLINIVLVYVFTYLLFNRSFVAALTTLLFAVHPLNVEAVVWISSRKDLLFTVFYLMGLIMYLIYLDRKKKSLLVVVFMLFLLSVLAKPIALTFPFVLLLIDFFKTRTVAKDQIIEKIPFVVISILVAITGVYLVKEYEVFATAPAGYNFFDKVCLAGYSLIFYLYNAFIPIDISNYHAYPFKAGTWLEAKYVISPLIVLFILFLVYKGWRKNFMLVTGLIMFLIIIGPTLRLIPTGYPITADRYFYLASIGLFWTVILTLEQISARSFPLQYIIIAISLVLVVVFCVMSFKRVSDWKDSYSLWNSTLRHDQYHEIANDHLGKLYSNAGDKDRALVHFQRIIERDKTKSDIMNSTGNILVDKKEPELALKYFNMAIASGNADHLPFYNRGLLYSEKSDFVKAINDFTSAIKIKPDFAEAYNNRGIARVKSGDNQGAHNDFQEAVRLKPSDKMMQDNLSRIKAMLNPSQE